MKKVLSIVVLSALGLVSTANANELTGFYVQGDLGASRTIWKDEGEAFKKTTFDPRISVGYQFGDFRVAADYTYGGKAKWSEPVDGVVESGYLQVHSLGLSAFYDIDFGSPIKPYVGIRLAHNRLTIVNIDNTGREKDKLNKFGYGAMLGAQYKISDYLAINAGLEYNHLYKGDGVKVHQYSIRTGLRYNF